MDITVARGLLMLMLSLDSMEDTMVDSVEDMDMEAMAIMDRFIVVDKQGVLLRKLKNVELELNKKFS